MSCARLCYVCMVSPLSLVWFKTKIIAKIQNAETLVQKRTAATKQGS